MIDTTATEPPRNWFLDLAKESTEDLLNEATRLRAKLAIAQQNDRRVDARAYELRILDVERAIAIHNRRATEQEDQRAAEERAPAAMLRGLRNAMLGWRDDIEDACLDWGHTITDRIDAMLKLAPATEERTLTEERVREVVRTAIEDLTDRDGVGVHRARVADRVAEKLAGAVVDPAQREADLRDAFCAGFAFAEDKADISEHDGWHRTNPRIEWPTAGQREQAAAEYARCKAGG